MASSGMAASFDTVYPIPQIQGLYDWKITPLFTVGEVLPSSQNSRGYVPVGSLDGIGVEKLDRKTVRAYVNHELRGHEGYSYALTNGTKLKGARVSFFDIDIEKHRIKNSGLAYTTVFDRQFLEVTNPAQINEGVNGVDGFTKFCSGLLVEKGRHNVEDTIFLIHEESDDTTTHRLGGSLWALDTKRGELHAVPKTGRGTWENSAALRAPGDKVALLLTDDTAHAPLWLYIGIKQASIYKIKQALPRRIAPPRNNFLNRNGLLVGDLFYFVQDSDMPDLLPFDRTGRSMKGFWRKIEVASELLAGQPGYDQYGYKHMSTLRQEAFAGGAFKFSRLEDVSANPSVPTEAVMGSTGGGSIHQSGDDWGTIYLINVDFINMRAQVKILYAGHDAGGGQFSAPDFGLRNPDNLDWANDGFIYIQEDPATKLNTFGGISGREASIWQLNPSNSTIIRIAEMDRSIIVPKGTTDNRPDVLGKWESSGILDVTNLFEPLPNIFDLNKIRKRILIGTVQAHSIQDGIIGALQLKEGGQLVLFEHITR